MIQGGKNSFVSRIIMLLKTLRTSYDKFHRGILPASIDSEADYEELSTARLMRAVWTFLQVAADEMGSRHLSEDFACSSDPVLGSSLENLRIWCLHERRRPHTQAGRR